MRTSRLLAFWMVLALFIPLSALAQTGTTGTLAGMVADPTGAAIPGARVEAVNEATAQTFVQDTNAAGQYVFASVPPGMYKITASMKGFNTVAMQQFKIDVAKSYIQNFSLEVSAVAQTVEVVSTGMVELQTSDSAVGNVLVQRQLARLPAFTRTANELLTLQPGVTYQGEVTGARSDQSTFTLDGIDVTNNSVGGLGTYVRLPIDSVEEFRVGVANPNASFGRGAGGQVAIISRRGANDYHGSAFWYHQNDDLNANSWTNNRTKVRKSELKDNRFGFTAGGPVLPQLKDRTFFFANYEGRRFPRSSDFLRFVPSDTLRQGILRFTDASGQIVSYDLKNSSACGAAGDQRCDPRALGLSPSVAAQFAKLPQGNDRSSGDGLNYVGFRSTVGNPLTNDYYGLRLDHNLTDKWRVDAAFRYFREIEVTGGAALQASIVGGNPTAVRSAPTRQNNAIVGVSGLFTPRLTGEFRFGWVRIRTVTQPIRPNAAATSLGIPGTDTSAGPIALDLTGLGGLGTTDWLSEPIDVNTQVARKQANDNRLFQWNANLTWVRNKHSVQYGTYVRYLPTLHQRDDKVLGALGALVAQIDSENAFVMPATNRPPTCSGTVRSNCLASADVQTWNRLFASALGIIDNVSVLAVRDGSFKPLPFGSLLESDTKLWAPEFYVQDTWRIRPSLTLTFGLNYGWQQAPTERLGRYTFQTDGGTGEPITSEKFFKARIEAAQQGKIFNPEFAFVPINSSKRGGVFDVDWNNWAPRVAAAWNPSFNSGLLGKVFGNRKTVLRGGYGLVYDRQNTVQSVIVPSLGVAFAQTLNVSAPPCNSTGAGGAGCAPTSGNPVTGVFRVGVDGSIPVPKVPEQSIPVSPPWCRTGSAACLFPETLSFQVDPFIRVGQNHAIDFSIQRELPKNMMLEVTYSGRLGRKLPQSMNLGQVPYTFVDPASKQTFGQAFDAVAAQLRAGVAAANVTPQPWFENLVPQGTRSLAAAGSGSFVNGNLNSLFLTVDQRRMAAGLAPFNNYLARTLFLRSSTGSSNYHGLLVTVRKRMSHGLTFDANYTLSRSLDQVGVIQNAASVMPNSFDLNAEYGPSNFDYTHQVAGHWVYEVPFHTSYRPLNTVFGGWSVSGIFRSWSGAPLTVTEGSQVWGGSLFLGFSSGAIPTVNPSSFGNNVQSNVVGSNNIGVNGNPAAGGSGLNLYSNPEQVLNSFRRVNVGTDGRAGRANPLRGPSRWNLDLSLGKKIAVRERFSVSVSADFFNIFNKVDYNNPTLDLTNPRAFGVLTSQFIPQDRTTGSRWIQMGLRIQF